MPKVEPPWVQKARGAQYTAERVVRVFRSYQALEEHAEPHKWLAFAAEEYEIWQDTRIMTLISGINKEVFDDRDYWNYEAQEKLFLTQRRGFFSVTGVGDRLLTNTIKSSYYSYYWNYMRMYFKDIPRVKSLEIVTMGFRWLLSKGSSHLYKLGQKLFQIVHFAHKGENADGIRKLVDGLVDDYPLTLEWEYGKEKPIDDDQLTIFFGLIHFSFGLAQLLVQIKDLEKVKEVMGKLILASRPYLAEEYLNVFSELVTLSELTIRVIFVEDLNINVAANIKAWRNGPMLTLHKTPGMTLCFLTSFFQLLSFLPLFPGNTKNCRGLNHDQFSELMIELNYLLNLYGRNTDNLGRLDIGTSKQCEVLSNFMILLIRMVGDNFSRDQGQAETLMVHVRKCIGILDQIMPKIERESIASEISSRLAHYLSHMSLKLRHLDQLALVQEASGFSYQAFTRVVDAVDKTDPTQYVVVMGDSFFKSKDYVNGLRLLAVWLSKYPKTLETQVCAFDFFEERLIFDWAYQWCRCKRETNDESILELSVVDFILHDRARGPEFMAQALRMEINAYLVSRNLYAVPLIAAGEHLEDNSDSITDTAVGLLAQVIGFWWGDETHEGFCVKVCEDVIEQLDAAARDDADNVQIAIMAAVARGWYAITYHRTLQTIAKKDMEFAKIAELDRNPAKNRELDSKSDRVVPALSSVNIRQEHAVASSMIGCIDGLYTVFQLDTGTRLKSWLDGVCPALVMTTLRLCAFTLSGLGDVYNSIRAYHCIQVMARLYDRKYIQLFAGMELYKLMPLTVKDSVTELEALSESGKKWPHISPCYFARIHMAKAIVAFRTKSYQDGIGHLGQVFALRQEGINLDANHLMMAECYYVLAQYLALPAGVLKGLRFGSINPNLTALTPPALATKAFRLLSGIARKPNPSSAWSDMFHNAHLLSVITGIAPGVARMLHEAGRLKELRVFASDVIYFCQEMALVSCSLAMLIPLAEIDIPAKLFDSAHLKIDGIDTVFSVEVPPSLGIKELTAKEVMNVMKKYDIETNSPIATRLVRYSEHTWCLTPVDLPAYHYPKGGRDEVFKDKDLFRERKYGVPKLLLHPLTCSCYTCMNPLIIPLAIRFMHVQARFAVAGKMEKKGLTMVSLARIQHQRALFRIMTNMEKMCLWLSQSFYSKKMGRDAIEFAYNSIYSRTMTGSLMSLMEMTPSSDVTFLAMCMKQIQEGSQILDEAGALDSLTMVRPVEVVAAAIFDQFFLSGIIEINRSSIRQVIRDASQVEVVEMEAVVTPERRQIPTSVAPPPVRPRRRL